jgi:hypothetical protein
MYPQFPTGTVSDAAPAASPPLPEVDMPRYEYSADEIRQLSDDLQFLSPRQQRLLGALLRFGLDRVDNGDGRTDGIVVDDPFDGARDVGTFRDLVDLSFMPGRIDDDKQTRGGKVGSAVAVTRTDGTR